MINRNKYFFIALLLVSFFSFYKLGSQQLYEWDESRYGASAFEMLHNHDYINIYYGGKPDTWNNKPPLMTWLIAASYTVFGFNEFALRFPSAIAAIVFFIFAWKIVRLYESGGFALACMLVLAGCKGIIGQHVGRTGDTDALLICFLTASSFYFLKYIDFNEKKAILFSAFFLGCAFWTKSTASFLLLPAAAVYISARKKWKSFLTDKKTWLAVLIFVFISGSWIALLYAYGVDYSGSFYGSSNAIETIFKNDTAERFFSANFGNKGHNYDHVITALDAKMNLWNYVFYLSLIILAYSYFKRREQNQTITSPLLVFSLVQFFFLALILTIAENKNVWYLAPVLLYVSVITVYGMRRMLDMQPVLICLFAGLFIFTITRHFLFLNNPETGMKDFFSRVKGKTFSSIYIREQPQQNFYLYLLWQDKPVVQAFDYIKPFGSNAWIVTKPLPPEIPANAMCYEGSCLTPAE